MVNWGRLEAAAFVAGFAVMVVEIGGARLMAPYLGDTLFTWTSSIAVILGALALGYYVGGRIADKKPDQRILSVFFFAAAGFIGLMPILAGPVFGVSAYLGFEYGPLLAAVILFAIPNVLLGLVAPCLIRFKVRTLKRVGGGAGNLYAISTAGSIVGALLTGFYFVPVLGIRETLFATSIILGLAGVALVGKRGVPVLIVLLLFALIPIAHQGTLGKVVYETDTPYYHLRVINYSGTLELQTDLSLQTVAVGRANTTWAEQFSNATYYPYQRLLYGNRGDVRGALYLGLGGGEMVTDLYRSTGINITVVEIDPVVISVARKYFNLSNSSRITIYNQDARFFLRNSAKSYGMLVMDAYGSSISMPYHLTSLEEVQEEKAHLAENGSVLINIVSPLSGSGSCAFSSIYETYAAVFPHLYVFPLDPQHPTRLQNIELVASDMNYSKSYIVAQLQGQISNGQMDWIENGSYESLSVKGCGVITDDRNPFDTYSAEALKTLPT